MKNKLEPSSIPYGSGYCVVCGYFFEDVKKSLSLGSQYLPYAPCCSDHIDNSLPTYVEWIDSFYKDVYRIDEQEGHIKWLRIVAEKFLWISEKPEHKWIYNCVDIGHLEQNDIELKMPSWNESIEIARSRTNDNLKNIFR